MVDKNSSSKPMVFESLNYKLLAVGLILVTVGFLAMYLENEVYGIISLYISPIVIISGYVAVIFSILVHSNKPQND